MVSKKQMNFKTNKLIYLLTASYCFFFLISCNSEINSDKDHLVFRYNEHSNIATLDPAFASNPQLIWPTNQLFNSLVQLDDELNVIATGRIGNYQSPSVIYHMENINGQIYITITDYGSTNLVKVLDGYGNEIASYTAGIMPGDLAYWKKSE